MFQPAGVYAASITPLEQSDEPDLPRLIAHSRWLLAHGCDGLGILGTTGEANSLSLAARRRVIEAAARDLPPDRLMPGIGSCALADAVDLSRLCLAVGARNVLVVPPFYYRPASEAAIEAFFSALIERVAEPSLRVFLYHIPQNTGFAFTLPMVRRLKARFGATIAGMKDSSGDFANMSAFAREIPDFRVFAGSEHFLLDILEAGGVGCISATTNVTAAFAQAVYRSRARADQDKASALRLAIQKRPLIAAMKGLVARYLGDAAYGRMLPPNLPMSETDLTALATELAALGLAGMK